METLTLTNLAYAYAYIIYLPTYLHTRLQSNNLSVSNIQLLNLLFHTKLISNRISVTHTHNAH